MELAEEDDDNLSTIKKTFDETLQILSAVGEPNILKRYTGGRFTQKVGQAAFEGIFLGIAQNLKFIKTKTDPSVYVLERIKKFWTQAGVGEFTKAGLTGTTRIQKTIPFGKAWFSK